MQTHVKSILMAGAAAVSLGLLLGARAPGEDNKPSAESLNDSTKIMCCRMVGGHWDYNRKECPLFEALEMRYQACLERYE